MRDAHDLAGDFQHRFVISGRVRDPHNVRPADAMLSLGYDRDGAGYGIAVPMTADGAFTTQTVYPGTYVLMVVRNPYSHTEPSMPVGLSVVRVEQRDVPNVTVTIQRDVEIRGRIRTASGQQLPARPHLTACLAEEGVRHAACRTADVAADGTFVLRNAYGLRLVTLAGRRSRVELDGRDITRVPTDFSTVAGRTLDVIVSR